MAIRLTPGPKADRLLAVAAGGDGRQVLKARVTASAEDGRTNQALLRLLSRSWRLPRRDLAIVSGAARRHKKVRVAGDPHQLLDRLGALIAALPGR